MAIVSPGGRADFLRWLRARATPSVIRQYGLAGVPFPFEPAEVAT
jgi:hypothetical protein